MRTVPGVTIHLPKQPDRDNAPRFTPKPPSSSIEGRKDKPYRLLGQCRNLADRWRT